MKKEINNYQELEKLNFQVLELEIRILKNEVRNLEKHHPFWFQWKKNKLYREEISKFKEEIMDISLQEKALRNEFMKE